MRTMILASTVAVGQAYNHADQALRFQGVSQTATAPGATPTVDPSTQYVEFQPGTRAPPGPLRTPRPFPHTTLPPPGPREEGTFKLLKKRPTLQDGGTVEGTN